MKLVKLSALCASLILSKFALANPSVEFVQSSNQQAKVHVVFVDDPNALTGMAAQLDNQSKGQLSRLLKLNEFDGKFGSSHHVQLLADVEHLVIMGSRHDEDVTAPDLQNLGGMIASELSSADTDIDAQIHLENIETSVQAPSAYIASGYHMRHYSFDKYLSEKDEGESSLVMITPNYEEAKKRYHSDLKYVAQGVHLARDFASEPGNNMYPQAFADVVESKMKGLKNVSIKVLGVKEMEQYNMGALMGVGKGSIHDPRLIVIEYMGGEKGKAPIALAGKGITFDTGGISLKGNDGMWAMKSDLSGAGAVAGVMYAIASRGEKVNVVGLMAMAENMPSRDAIRPGDVLDTMKGTSIEIMSTDAEGRLVLSDAVYYAQQEYKPSLLLNIATLTGSAARALSDEYAALITRNFEFSVKMMDVGKRSGEHVWPLPLHPNHFEQIKSPIADIKNSGAGSPGASIGAAVIGTFVDESLPWVHLDIAGVDWLSGDIDVAPEGSQGWGVRFMDQLVRDHAAKKSD